MLQAQRALPRLRLAPVHHRILGEMHKEERRAISRYGTGPRRNL